MKNQFERAGRGSIPRFWSVFVICIYGEEDYRVYRAKGIFPELIDGHIHGTYRDTICQYDNTRAARTYTIREPV